MSIRRSSLICVAYLQVYERVADNRWWPNIGGLLYVGRCLSCCVRGTLSTGRIYIEQLLIMLQCKNRSDWKHRREVVNC